MIRLLFREDMFVYLFHFFFVSILLTENQGKKQFFCEILFDLLRSIT